METRVKARALLTQYNAIPFEQTEKRQKLINELFGEVGENVESGTIICPGVTLGDNTSIGAGSVITKDIPVNVFAAGPMPRYPGTDTLSLRNLAII